jgi:hypothetical protein
MPNIARQRQTLELPRKHLLQGTRPLAITRRQPIAKQLVHNRRRIKPVLHRAAARFTFDKDHNRVTPSFLQNQRLPILLILAEDPRIPQQDTGTYRHSRRQRDLGQSTQSRSTAPLHQSDQQRPATKSGDQIQRQRI